MAERIVEQNYKNMIDALGTFGSAVSVIQSELESIATLAQSELGEGDSDIESIAKQVKSCCLKYAELSNQAIEIANAMQEELDEYIKDRRSVDEDSDA